MTNAMIVVALAFALIAGLIWFSFLRPVPAQTAVGVIRNKSFKPAGQYWQQPVGNRDGFWTPTRIPIAECYILGVQVDGRAGEAQVALNTIEAQGFDVGQRVQIEYVERGLPLIWKRIYVTGMRRADASTIDEGRRTRPNESDTTADTKTGVPSGLAHSPSWTARPGDFCVSC